MALAFPLLIVCYYSVVVADEVSEGIEYMDDRKEHMIFGPISGTQGVGRLAYHSPRLEVLGPAESLVLAKKGAGGDVGGIGDTDSHS